MARLVPSLIWRLSFTYIFLEGGVEGGVSLVRGAGEGGDAVFEVEDESVLVEKLLAEARGIGLEGRDT